MTLAKLSTLCVFPLCVETHPRRVYQRLLDSKWGSSQVRNAMVVIITPMMRQCLSLGIYD